jgi:hypothetical protein
LPQSYYSFDTGVGILRYLARTPTRAVVGPLEWIKGSNPSRIGSRGVILILAGLTGGAPGWVFADGQAHLPGERQPSAHAHDAAESGTIGIPEQCRNQGGSTTLTQPAEYQGRGTPGQQRRLVSKQRNQRVHGESQAVPGAQVVVTGTAIEPLVGGSTTIDGSPGACSRREDEASIREEGG